MRDQSEPDRVLATVLFADIVGSTELAAKMGNRRWQDIIQSYYGAVRAELARFRGSEISTAGDGVFASFDGPARAIRCGLAICEAVRRLGIEVRIGIHTGECELVAEKIGGIAVNIGARVAALAQSGEVLVSTTVRDLVVSVLGISFGAPKPVSKDGFSSKILEKERRLLEQTEGLRERFRQDFRNAQAQFRALRQRCETNDYESIRLLMKFCHERHHLPGVFRNAWDVDIDQTSRVALCTIEIPDFHSIAMLKKSEDRWKAKAASVSPTERRRLNETIIYSLCLRTAYLVAKCNVGAWFDIVAINATQKWHDTATGRPREGVIATLQASVSEIVQMDLTRADPKACFRHLKGLSTPSTEDVTPVRPIFVLNKEDQRIVEEKDVAENLEPESNIASMPWEDFEHLVRQLFEWEFGRGGVEVKVTRASRDRGVDAIMFDPDPLRGGNISSRRQVYLARK